MARFVKSLATEREDITTPEHYLWVSVLSKAAHDAMYSSDWLESRKAIAWFKANRADFKEVCRMAGRNPAYVYTRMLKPLEKRESHMKWVRSGNRYYVKNNEGLCRGGIVYHSHYRHGKKRGPYKKRKKKHLTGNAYYAAKAAKEMKTRNIRYVMMGKKGGRPRMYNNV